MIIISNLHSGTKLSGWLRHCLLELLRLVQKLNSLRTMVKSLQDTNNLLSLT